MTSTARQLRQPPTIEAIERVPYFANIIYITALAENGRTWLAELNRTCGYITRGLYKRTLL